MARTARCCLSRLAPACATASYTLLDGTGARVAGDAIAYVAWVFVADGVFFASGMLLWKGLAVLPRQAKPWGTGMIAAAASYGGLWRVGLGDDRGTDSGGGCGARNLDLICGADRLAGVWRKDDARQGDCRLRDCQRRDLDAALAAAFGKDLLRDARQDQVKRGQSQPPMRGTSQC